MIKVLDPGFYTSIQDAGRFGCQNYGVPVTKAGPGQICIQFFGVP